MTNPHLSLHIAPADRISVPTQRKRNGHVKRPSLSITSILSNVHLLLRVPSFARWPLKLHFFNRQVHATWSKHCAAPGLEPLRQTLDVVTDFAPTAVEAIMATRKAIADSLEQKWSDDEDSAEEEGEQEPAAGRPTGPTWGIHALPLDHYPLATYLEKGRNVIDFEREGSCVVCHQQLDHEKGLYPICSNGTCEGVGHLDCWSRHLLHQQDEESNADVILPMEGRCPKCDGAVRWVDMMKELTLRTRGQKDVDKILKKHGKATGVTKPKVKSAATGESPTGAEIPAKAKSSAKAKSPSKARSAVRAKSPARAQSPTRAKSPAKAKGPIKGKGKAKATGQD